MWRVTKLFFWRLLALISLTLGLIGIPLPGLPTVPFILLSAWSAGKGWPVLEYWLLSHSRLGPPVLAWREYGIVPRRAKYLASAMMTLSIVLIQLSTAPMFLKILLPLFLLLIACWLWRRPEHTKQDKKHEKTV